EREGARGLEGPDRRGPRGGGRRAATGRRRLGGGDPPRGDRRSRRGAGSPRGARRDRGPGLRRVVERVGGVRAWGWQVNPRRFGGIASLALVVAVIAFAPRARAEDEEATQVREALVAAANAKDVGKVGSLLVEARK